MRINPWLIAVLVSVATFMEVLDTTIAQRRTALYFGGLAVGPAEAAWTITSYLVANLVVLCASSWLAATFGRRNFFLSCIALFTVSSILCGLAWNLESLLLFRVLQGLAGGGMTPVAQSILADTFPPKKRGQAFALYGIAVVVAPIVGPVLGGYISDNYSWHWCFLINGPIGAVLSVLIYMFILENPEARADRMRGAGGRRDSTLSASCWWRHSWARSKSCSTRARRMIGSGPRSSSSSPLSRRAPCCCSRHGRFSRKIRHRCPHAGEPAVRRLFPGHARRRGDRDRDDPDRAADIARKLRLHRSARRGSAFARRPCDDGHDVRRGPPGFIQPKYLIAFGAVVVAYGTYMLTSLYADSTFGFFAVSRMVVGLGLPFMFIPITVASYDGIAAGKTDQASALINLARNFGGSIGVSLSQTVLAQRQQFHQLRLSERVGDWNPLYYQALNGAKGYFAAQPLHGGSAAQAALGLDRRKRSTAGRLSQLYRRVSGAEHPVDGARAACTHATRRRSEAPFAGRALMRERQRCRNHK